MATDEPKKHWSERKPPEGWAKITQSKKAAKAEMVDGGRTKAEAEEMEEEEEEEEDDEIPLWRRALMKKKAKEQKMKGQAEKQQVGLLTFPPNDTIWCHHGHGLSISLWEFIWGV